MSRLARVLVSSVTVILGVVVVAACGSPPPEENPAQSNEALAKLCPSWGCGPNPGFPACTTWPRALDSDPVNAYTNPYVPWHSAECFQNKEFTPAMEALRCQPEFYYQATTGGLVEPVALCPSVPEGTFLVTPDACTGAPPSGWSFVSWSYTDPCLLPGTGCHSGACLNF